MAALAAPAVQVDRLRKDFSRRKRRFPALNDVSFEVARGECVAVLGQNGSGKSTLVRLLSTLLLPDGGTARIFGNDVVRDARAVRRPVTRGSVAASSAKTMAAAEDLGYAARCCGRRR
jgi:ABC-2 type transport system ATP-binding protein